LAGNVPVVTEILAKQYRGSFLWDTLYSPDSKYYRSSNRVRTVTFMRKSRLNIWNYTYDYLAILYPSVTASMLEVYLLQQCNVVHLHYCICLLIVVYGIIRPSEHSLRKTLA